MSAHHVWYAYAYPCLAWLCIAFHIPISKVLTLPKLAWACSCSWPLAMGLKYDGSVYISPSKYKINSRCLFQRPEILGPRFQGHKMGSRKWPSRFRPWPEYDGTVYMELLQNTFNSRCYWDLDLDPDREILSPFYGPWKWGHAPAARLQPLAGLADAWPLAMGLKYDGSVYICMSKREINSRCYWDLDLDPEIEI